MYVKFQNYKKCCHWDNQLFMKIYHLKMDSYGTSNGLKLKTVYLHEETIYQFSFFLTKINFQNLNHIWTRYVKSEMHFSKCISTFPWRFSVFATTLRWTCPCMVYILQYFKNQNIFWCRFFSLRHYSKFEKFAILGKKLWKIMNFCFFVIKMVKMAQIGHYFVIYKLPYTNKDDCFLFEKKILIFRDFREISIFFRISAFYIRI